MIDEKKFMEFMTALEDAGAEHVSFDDLRKFVDDFPKIGGWLPCSEGKITAEQKCIADLVNFAMTVSDRLKKKDFSLFSPTSGIGGGMKIGMPPICRMSDELISLHEEVINEAMRAKRNE